VRYPVAREPLRQRQRKRNLRGRCGVQWGREAAGDDGQEWVDNTLGRQAAQDKAEDGIRDGTVTGVQTCALPIDRKSTRLNSSHSSISYAVFCFVLRCLTSQSVVNPFLSVVASSFSSPLNATSSTEISFPLSLTKGFSSDWVSNTHSATSTRDKLPSDPPDDTSGRE